MPSPDDTSVAEKPARKKRARTATKKTSTTATSAPAEKPPMAPPPQARPEPPRRSSSHGSGGRMVFVILLMALVILAIYVVQRQQTISVVNRLSQIEGTLDEKFAQIEEKVQADTGEEATVAMKDNEHAVLDATTKQYVSNVYGFSFRYPANYEIVDINTDIRAERRESITLVASSILSALKDQHIESADGPASITVTLYENTAEEPLDMWLTERAQYVHLDSDSTLSEIVVDGHPALSYETEGLGPIETVAVEDGGYVLIASNMYGLDENTEMRDVFADIIGSLTF